MRFRSICLSVVFLFSLTSPSRAQRNAPHHESDPTGSFPVRPNLTLTPGTLCAHATEIRYAERIAYCDRDVAHGVKDAVIRNYDRRLGYRVESMNRADFKIDHYIPLCMGGSNEESNLWPQHRSVYFETDPLEGRLCELMAAGSLKQAEATSIIRRAKASMDEARRMVVRYSRSH